MEALSSPRADCVSTVLSGTQGSRLANPNDPSAAVVRVRLLSSEDDLIAGAVIGHELTVPVDTGRSRMLVRREHGKRAWLASSVVQVDVNQRAWLRGDIVDVPGEWVMRLVISV